MDKNVIDFYKSWRDEDIKSDLSDSRLPMRVVAENINGDFNKATVMRSAEGFNLESFILAGNRKMDMRGAVGTQFRINFEKVPTVSDSTKTGYTNVVLDNVPGAVSIYDYDFPENVTMILGEEQRGVSQDALDIADVVLYIPMRGAVRSFNVGSSASMAMYEYVRQHGA